MPSFGLDYRHGLLDRMERRWRSTNFFFITWTSRTEIYTLSLHDALPILAESGLLGVAQAQDLELLVRGHRGEGVRGPDRKSTRLNSSHEWTSYAVFCLKKKVYIRPSSMREKSPAYSRSY